MLVVAVIRVGDCTDAARDVNLVTVEDERLADDLEEFLRDELGVFERRHLGQDHGELVAAQASDGVLLADDRAKPFGDLLQQQIADGVSQAVVDHLEAIEVDVEDGEPPAIARGAGDRLTEPIEEQLPVRQPGQRVVVREVRQRGLASLGDATHEAEAGADAEVLARGA